MRRLSICLLCLLPVLCLSAAETVLTVGTTVVRPAAEVPPLGVNNTGHMGANHFAANNAIPHPGNEPVVWRNLHRVRSVSSDGSLTIDGGGVSWYDLWGGGFLADATVRVYRLVDAAGEPLPTQGNDIDEDLAAGFVKVGTTRVAPVSEALPDGGWIVDSYGDVYPSGDIGGANPSFADHSAKPGVTYWYRVRAYGPDNKAVSDWSTEISASHGDDDDAGPAIRMVDKNDILTQMWPRGHWDPQVQAIGGRPPLRWSLANADELPAGLTIDATSGRLNFQVPEERPGTLDLRVVVTDADGRSDERRFTVHPPSASPTAGQQPSAPTGLSASPCADGIALRWQAPEGVTVRRYQLQRATKPGNQQRDRVILADALPVRLGDYLCIEKAHGLPDMELVHPRVRGIGNPIDQSAWHWNTDLTRNRLALVPHPGTVPPAYTDPGATCLRWQTEAADQEIWCPRFIAPGRGKESDWYGFLWPGKTYQVSFWMRQEGLADNGRVTFDLHGQLKSITQTWQVTGDWQRYSYTFTAPPAPTSSWHYGPALTISGPGTLWLDNGDFRLVETDGDAEATYVPQRFVLDELIASQPDSGPKGALRLWFLNRHATMDSICSWHANAKWSPNWISTVSASMRFTLPMGLDFALRTGDSPDTRMRPWLVIQHLTHSEAEWRGLIEYLAAPYDPATDSPQSKPWAYKRSQQRGHGRPWTDDFSEIMLQFGNETWHNGAQEEWLGFSWRGHVFQGGRAYGLAMDYLSREIARSPWWSADKLPLIIDGGYIQNRPQTDGSWAKTAYGPRAAAASTIPTRLTQANYIGPKWETGDSSQTTFTDEGLQNYLLAWPGDLRAKQDDIVAAKAFLADQGRRYELNAYEGGPSGFAIPGRASAAQVEVNERYGKSLAAGVAALDTWLGSYLQGWTDQCYLGYYQGSHWASHSTIHKGFHPTPGWLALTMRNRYARGDMVEVTSNDANQTRWNDTDCPLIGAYAFSHQTQTTVFVLSRSIDETIPVRIALPERPIKAVALHRLTGNPRDNNRETRTIDIETVDLPHTVIGPDGLVINSASGGSDGGMPPGSVYCYVFSH